MLLPRVQEVIRGVTALAEVINPDDQEEVGFCYTRRISKEYVWNPSDILRHSMVFPLANFDNK